MHLQVDADEQRLVRYGQLFAVQPFGNHLVVKTFTGAQLRAALEQQFDSGTNTPERPRVLSVSAGFGYSYDLSRPAGARISHMVLHGQPLTDEARVRVAMSNYLAGGGDNFTVFAQVPDMLGGGQDLDALEAYHSEHSAAQVRQIVDLAAQHGLLLCGGSDYHGQNKPDVAMVRGRGGLRIPAGVLDKLKERRALRINGQPVFRP